LYICKFKPFKNGNQNKKKAKNTTIKKHMKMAIFLSVITVNSD
jgi:hypothetical protein